MTQEYKVKGVIIAAGMGNRLNPLTNELPKCMLAFGDKTLLQHQLQAYHDNDITEISLIRGFMKEKIDYPNLTFYENPDYHENNILCSLMCAEEAINQHVVVSYSDILFESVVISRLLQSDHDISIVVDIDFRGNYVGRRDHPINEAESVIFDANNYVVEVGKIMTSKKDVHGEFIGMMKLSPRGAEIFKNHFHTARQLFDGKPFKRAAEFRKAYLTDMIQYMVDMGVRIHCVIIERGWREIDTVEDYEKALQELED